MDEAEVREFFDHADESRLLVDHGQIVAAAWTAGVDSVLILDPDVDPVPIYADLLPWFAARPGATVEALSQDELRCTALSAQGWQHLRSAFDLQRAVTPDWVIAEADWPAGVVARDFRREDAALVHHLIYVDSIWAAVAGHHERDFEEWAGLFVNERTLPEQQVLAWRADRLIGVALGRTFSDGTGWVSQLAVAEDERGRGLGRALLLDALRRRRQGGATAVGLSVKEQNRGAIALYLGVGLQIEREWKEYELPR